jgi:hypothetical protein
MAEIHDTVSPQTMSQLFSAYVAVIGSTKSTAAVDPAAVWGTIGHGVLKHYLSCKLKHAAAAAGTVLLGARGSAKITPCRRIIRVPATLHVGVWVRQIRVIEDVLSLGAELKT